MKKSHAIVNIFPLRYQTEKLRNLNVMYVIAWRKNPNKRCGFSNKVSNLARNRFGPFKVPQGMLRENFSTPSYSNKHNVSLQYIVQFSKLLSKMWSIFTNCFWVQIFKNLKFLKFEWKFRHQILDKIIKIIIQIYWQNLVPKFQPKFEIW
jgi:hypothetical protein